MSLLSAAVTTICFSGSSSLRLHITPGQVVTQTIRAEIPFQYESEIQTQRLRERKRQRIAPIYKVDTSTFGIFQEKVAFLAGELEVLDQKLQEDTSNAAAWTAAIETFTKGINQRYDFTIDAKDISTLLTHADAQLRAFFWEEGLGILAEIMARGVTNSAFQNPSMSNVNYFINVDMMPNGKDQKLRTQEEALFHLRVHLGALEKQRQATNALFHILSQGIQPNLTYDREKTEEKKSLAGSSVRPVVMSVEADDVIIGGNSRVTPLEYEKLQAYRSELSKQSRHLWRVDHNIWNDFAITFAILACAIITFRTCAMGRFPSPVGEFSRRNLVFLAALGLLNLFCLRVLSNLWGMRLLLRIPCFFRIVPFMAPVFFGPIIVTLLLGPYVAMFYGLLLDIFFTMMLGKNGDFFVIFLISMSLTVILSRQITYRTQVLRVATTGGFCLGLGAMWLTSFASFEIFVALGQFLGATAGGMVNGLLVILLLNPCERFSRMASNIKLQELSDFNHKLLRQLQVYAPGTYHHSLVVSAIAEQVANEVGANALLCRVAAFFHDVGKITKPEYFIENQTGDNPHTEKSPRISVLIIKNHVREGAELAASAGIPPQVIRIIQQHHGTTLIQYFYNKACQLHELSDANEGDSGESGDRPVEEFFYRYDGPKPQSLEAAVLMLVDSCEAASRILRKVTRQSIEALVCSIFKAKIDDGQLDDCFITHQQVRIIRQSIISTLTNILHSRISYSFHTDGQNEPSGIV
ncbi:MAG: HDIG domain-containing protein [Puniceicoccales bacterium]|jgi:putative nucleotidyltransferase with HDIG domain|nr:HDIG domain-containing protein [Puniceicoccales bacterium]